MSCTPHHAPTGNLPRPQPKTYSSPTTCTSLREVSTDCMVEHSSTAYHLAIAVSHFPKSTKSFAVSTLPMPVLQCSAPRQRLSLPTVAFFAACDGISPVPFQAAFRDVKAPCSVQRCTVDAECQAWKACTETRVKGGGGSHKQPPRRSTSPVRQPYSNSTSVWCTTLRTAT